MAKRGFGFYLNRFRYTIYTPIYDLIVAPFFRNQRHKSISNLNIKPGSKVLIVGAGTGLDFEFLPKDIELHAGDITPSMVSVMKSKARKMGLDATITVMDGHALNYPDASFDYIILHLIIAVIPDARKAIKEVERVSMEGARISIFDKFVPQGRKPSVLRQILNIPSSILFSDITRDADHILSHTELQKISDEPAAFGGQFRLILAEKQTGRNH